MDGALYYQLTEESYFALCPELSGHMNMGLWPSQTLRQAQEKLVREVLSFHRSHSVDFISKGIVDAGCGWGGSRALFYELLPDVPYFGFNTSERQLSHSRERNKRIPNTNYYLKDIHEIDSFCPADSLISIEAAFHFQRKRDLIGKLKRLAIQHVTLADIVVDKFEAIEKLDLLQPALSFAWSSEQYRKAFEQNGFRAAEIQDVSSRVFEGWSKYLHSIDSQTYRGRKRLLQQFQIGFHQMQELSVDKDIRYLWMHFEAIQ